MKKRYLLNYFCLMMALSSLTVSSFAQSDIVADPLTILKEGNTRFYSGAPQHNHQDMMRVADLKGGQNPLAVIVSCSDSRVTPEIVFDQGLGDVFSIRTAGNVMADYEEGSIEYAAEHLGTKLIVVMGHTGCGAVKAFMDVKHGGESEAQHDKHKLGHIKSIVDKMGSEEEEDEIFRSGEGTYDKAVKANVIHGVRQLRKSEPFLSEMYKDSKINIVGAIYNIETGVVEFLDI